MPERALDKFMAAATDASEGEGVSGDIDCEAGLAAAMKQLREELESDGAINAGSKAAFVEVSALLESDIHAAISAAFDYVLSNASR